MPREQLAELQLERLRATLSNAYDQRAAVHQRLDAAACGRTTSAAWTTSRSLPFTVKTDLRDHYPFGLFARPREQLARLHASSGTTGKPTVVGYTRDDIDNWADLMARSLYCGRRAAAATSCTTPTATACSPAGWARTTAPSASARWWCRCRAARPSARSR